MNQQLNYEQTKFYTWEVTANFTDGVVSKAIVEVNVLDVNDECPKFSQSVYTVYHTEPMENGLIIALTDVTDGDSSGKLTYSIVSGDNRFIIGSDGILRANATIETETLLTLTTYPINIRVSDGNCQDNARVDVISKKIVVNSYLFGEPYYIFQLSEFENIGRVIHRFSNIGGHKGTYRVEEQTPFFAMNASTGKYYSYIYHLFIGVVLIGTKAVLYLFIIYSIFLQIRCTDVE